MPGSLRTEFTAHRSRARGRGLSFVLGSDEGTSMSEVKRLARLTPSIVRTAHDEYSAPDPPHVIARARAPIRAGECWVFKGGSFRLANRADLDALDARSGVHARSQTQRAIDVADEPLAAFKARVLASADRTADRLRRAGMAGVAGLASPLWQSSARSLRSLYLLALAEDLPIGKDFATFASWWSWGSTFDRLTQRAA